MSGIIINVHTHDDCAQSRTPAGIQRTSKKRRHKNSQQFKGNGSLEGKRNHKRRKRQSGHGQAPPQPNGAPTWPPSRPTSVPNAGFPRPSSTARTLSTAYHCYHELSRSSTATVNNEGPHGRPEEPVNAAPPAAAHTPAASSSHRPSAAQTSTGNPTKYLALDCEMVGVGPKGSVSQLARCSIVSYDGDVVYDKFIKPTMPVTDYRTRWSGIRHRDLVNATPHIVARKEILKVLMGKVVVGHAIHNDFKALGYSHPSALTRDTSRIPLLNAKAGFPVEQCASLKRLSKAILNRDIQVGRKGHSSVEDAKATMELYKVVEMEWERKLASAAPQTH